MSQIQDHYYPPRVKICGITTVDDAIAAMNAGADAIGVVFYEPSPRYVSISVAQQIARAVGPFVSLVGLFVNAERSQVERVLNTVPLHLLQFHGSESVDDCEYFQRPYMKALRMKADLDVEAEMAVYSSASAILLDSYRSGVPGGTGVVFDWGRVPALEKRLTPLVLAGGLAPDNVQQAISLTCPYAVDVSGGVELAPGRKDPQQMLAFVRNVKQSGH